MGQELGRDGSRQVPRSSMESRRQSLRKECEIQISERQILTLVD